MKPIDPSLIARVAALIAIGGSSSHVVVAQEIHGAGATFPAPVYRAWSKAYAASHDVHVLYDAVGSGSGIDRVKRHEVDFGGTDAPLTPEGLAAARLVQF